MNAGLLLLVWSSHSLFRWLKESSHTSDLLGHKAMQFYFWRSQVRARPSLGLSGDFVRTGLFFPKYIQHPYFFFNLIFHFSRQTSHPLWFSYLFVVLRLASLVCPFNLLSFSSLKHLLFAPSLFMIFNWRLSRDVWPAKTVCVDSITEEGQLQSVALLIENPCTGEKTGLRSTSFLIIPKSHLIF